MSVRTKKRNKIRLIIQAIAFAFSNGYTKGFVDGKIYTGSTKIVCNPGLNCYSCPGALLSCPIGALQAVLNSRQFNFSCYILGFLMVVGALTGRVVCGWLCPFGLYQRLLYKIPIFKKVKVLKYHQQLKYLKYIILLLFVIILPIVIKDKTGQGMPFFCAWLCPSGTLLGGIPLVSLNERLYQAIGIRFNIKLFSLIILSLLSIKCIRPFCKYICPLGALYGLFNPIAIYRFSCDENKCIKCKKCQRVCPQDIKVWESPNDFECIRCTSCITECPTGALQSTISKNKEKK